MHYYNPHKSDEYIYMALSVLIYIPETSMPAASWAVRDIPTCQCTDVLQFLWTANGNSWPDIDGGQTAGHRDISGPGMSFAARGQMWKLRWSYKLFCHGTYWSGPCSFLHWKVQCFVSQCIFDSNIWEFSLSTITTIMCVWEETEIARSRLQKKY